MYTISGRIIAPDGSPVPDIRVRVRQLANLATDPVNKGLMSTTDSDGHYIVSWAESAPPSSPWDLFVEAKNGDGTIVVESRLITDLSTSTTVDLIWGEGSYLGRSEWDRISGPIEAVLNSFPAKDVPSSRLEWVTRRANVFPTLTAMYLQAHRLSDGRTVKAQTCYACLRHGLPADLPGLLRAGRAAWEDALRTGWTERIIPLPGDGSIEDQNTEVVDELAALDELVVDNAVYDSATGVNRRKILDTGGLDENDQRTFTELWLAHEGTLAEFWEGATTALGSSKVADLQFTLQATTLVGNHLETLSQLQVERRDDNIATVRDLAAWDQSAWEDFLDGEGPGIPVEPPDTITGANLTERRQKYARALRRLVEEAYPTDVLRHRLAAESSPPAHTEELVGFFTNNPDFDITNSNIAAWVADNPTAFNYATDAAQARADLEIVQRVHRITPRLGRYESTVALLDNGVTSAADIANYTREEFRAAFATVLPSEHHDSDKLAYRIWDNAQRIHSSTLAIISSHALARSGGGPVPVQNLGNYTFGGSGNGLETLDAILGNLDYCACTHCRSVFSPAAYLADLLKFLDDRKAKAPYADALAVLRDRRPDLEHILLDCANTNTVLPQIDLAIELLERKFAGTLEGSSPQTTWSTEQLLAHPEHVLAGVYENTLPGLGTKLDEYVHPWALPFSLPVLESRTYLAHLGVAREQLMRLLDNGSGPSPEAIAAEALGLSMDQFAIVADTWTASADKREFWGFDPNNTDDDDWDGLLAGDPLVEGSDPGELLRRGDYELGELRGLLDLTFIDPVTYTGPYWIEFQWSETCALADAEIINLNIAALDRLHRFTRLARATKLSPRMLNILIEQVGGGVLNKAFLQELPRIIDLHERTRLDYDVLATWWSDRIDAQAYESGPQSLYHRRFLAPELQASGFFLPFNQTGLTLFGDENELLSEADLAVVLSATRLSAADYAKLLTTPGEHVFTSDDRGKFKFRFFAELLRAASFMRAAKLSAQEFTILMTLLDDVSEDPFASPNQTWKVMEWLDLLRGSKLSLSEVAYLLRHDLVGKHGDDEAKVGRAFVELVRGLRTIADETGELVDPDGKATELNLATIILDENGHTDEGVLAEVMAILANTSTLPTEQDKEEVIDAHFASFIDTSIAKAQLVTGGGALGGEPSDAPARYAWVLREFIGNLRRRTLLTDLAAREQRIPAAAAEALLFDVLRDPGADQSLAKVFLVDFASEQDITIGVDSSSHPDEFHAWTRLSKAAAVVRAFAIDPSQIKWCSDHSDWVDFNALPLSPTDDKIGVDKWITLLEAMAVRRLFASADGHQRLEAASDLGAAVDVLVEATGWDAGQLETLLGTAYLNLTDPTELGAPAQLIRVRKLADTSAQTGASLLSLWSWIHPSGTEFAVANEIKAAARGRHDAASWAKVAPPLRDKIRVGQRDALVAANLAANPSLKNRDALSDELLIDVAISPCAKTSRIGQAISSVQLFIHRVFIRLEANDVEFKEEVGDLWSWMKNYRIWEANRKVFLYPENWISPELRGDKTPEFQAFESTLMQDTLDEYRVERALSGYLEALALVSNLEVVGVWSKLRFAPPVKELWVLARTQNPPYEYYLRHRGNWGEWRPWEAIPLNIEGDNVALVRHDDRLFLFWLLIHEGATSLGAENSSFNAVHLSIAWSEYTQTGWEKVNMSERSHAIAKQSKDMPGYRLQFWSADDRIRLLVLAQPLALWVKPVATFDYDVVAKRIDHPQCNFDPSDPDNALYIGEGAWLKDHKIISLQGGYDLSQRYEKKTADGEIRFTQGAFENTLFASHPERGVPALVHQADLWDPKEPKNSKFTPVIYDDRRRKYLLEPTQSLVGLGTDGDDIIPAKLGHLDITGILKCEGPSDPAILAPSPPLPEARKIREGLIIPRAFTVSGVPGQEPDLVMMPGIDGLNIMAGNEEAMLANAKNTQNGSIVFDDANNVDPDVFWLKIEPLYHPYAHKMVDLVSRLGPTWLYDEKVMFRQLANSDPLKDKLKVNEKIVWGDAPLEEFDFEFGSAYGVYNWEIFYHAPTLIASKLTTDQRFEEAQNWMHKIFDPIRVVEGEAGPEKFWRIKPFYEQAQAIMQDQFEAMLGIGVTKSQQQLKIAQFDAQITEWRRNPFDPHAIARIRPGTYQRALLMQYFDNLIAWADSLFRRDTVESINEAFMLYMLVSQLLGERPREVPGPEGNAKSYDDLVTTEGGLDNFANAAIQLENWVLGSTEPAQLFDCVNEEFNNDKRYSVPLRFWYFCYPPNPKMLGYWDIVEDRLWKIRNCQNIDGVVRQLPLFQPPIDPALLVAATAAGVDLASALAELDSGLPPYRFRYVWGRAQTIANELRSLGGALLSALEKRDAEELAVLRAGQEVSLLEAIRQVRLRRIDEAVAAIEALRSAQDVLHHRRGYYAGLIGNKPDDSISAGEQNNLDKLEMAQKLQAKAQIHRSVAALVGLFPNFKLGTGAFTDFGGSHLGSAISAGAEVFGAFSAKQSYEASKVLTNAQYDRRREEWVFQRDSTDHDLTRIEKDRVVAEIRLAIAQRELADHDLQVANAREIERFMRDKYTDQQLYDWMIGQLSTLYFQTYQLAFDLAKRAERAYRHELAIRDQAQPIIKYGYWDSLRKGLLAGERLGHDLARLDIAYMDKDVREYELRKSVSLAQLAPEQLLCLQETGECDIDLPELLFDLDHPGHYLRRTRAVRLTIPAVVGPYTTLGATLQLVSHVTRIKTDVSSGYMEKEEEDDGRFVHGYGGGQAIATSNAVADAGVFNLDFKDERYLPFEYTGAVSSWRLRLPEPAKVPQFDYRTISDVIVNIDYTAREGGDTLREVALNAASAALASEALAGGYQVFVVQDAFPNEWETFLSPGVSETTHRLTLPIRPTHFPYFAQRKGITVNSIDVHMVLEPSVSGTVTGTAIDFFDDAMAEPPGTPVTRTFAVGTYGNTITASFDSLTAAAQSWQLEIDTTEAVIPIGLDPEETGFLERSVIAGMVLVVHYSLES